MQIYEKKLQNKSKKEIYAIKIDTGLLVRSYTRPTNRCNSE